MEKLAREIGLVADIVSIVGLIALLWGVVASFLLWRTRYIRHRFSRVYFPKDRQDFYSYYIRAISKATRAVYITSDGFNMSNGESRDAAIKMNEAQTLAIKRGATVIRYQITSTMHISWLHQIALMKRAHGDRYRTFINPQFENIGHFAVIDPGTRKAIVEFMLPNPGGISQATLARDFGFIHGHQAKADLTKSAFEQIMNHPDTIEITESNYRALACRLFDSRLCRHLERTSDYHLFDEEVMLALRKCDGGHLTFESVRFCGWPQDTATLCPSSEA